MRRRKDVADVLYAGIERVPITPPIGIMLTGYAARAKGSEYVLDDLYATALVLDNGKVRLALVTCDLIYIHPTAVAQIRREIAAKTGIPAAQVMICCSHTHSGPITYMGPAQSKRDRAYAANLTYQIAGAVAAANHQLQPVRIGYGRSKAYVGLNRREQRPNGQVVLGTNLAGPTDPEILTLRLDSADGQPLALVVSYACHAVALSSESYGVSADWPGAMRWAVESATGATCFFVQGACADINPRGGPSTDYGRVQALGQSVAGGVLQSWADTETAPGAIPLAGIRKELLLPLLGPLGADGKPVASGQEVVAAAMRMPWEDVAKLRAERFPWYAPVREAQGVWHTPVELQTFRLGEAAVAAIAAEPFVEVGLAVKARSPLPYTMFAGYSNGSVGYLPTADAYEIGGYEVVHSYVWYHLPAPLAPTCARQVEDTAIAFLDKLSRKNETA
jgi:neutral ceramidase